MKMMLLTFLSSLGTRQNSPDMTLQLKNKKKGCLVDKLFN